MDNLIEFGNGEHLGALVRHAEGGEHTARRVEAVVGETEEESDEQDHLDTGRRRFQSCGIRTNKYNVYEECSVTSAVSERERLLIVAQQKGFYQAVKVPEKYLESTV